MFPENRLLLIDGLAGAYRFFHAIRGMSTKTGVPTNALFGFVRMIEQLTRAWKPTHRVVVFDGGTPPHRLELIPDYKAQRAPMPEALRAQLPLLNAYLDAAAISHLRLEATEADDVIATLATQARQDGCPHVLVASGDKDLFQLVDGGTRMVSLSGEPTSMDRESVFSKTGVYPEQIPDWLALTGDNADNIRGVPGVGPKTAARLLVRFGSLEHVFRQLEQVDNERLRRLLETHRSTIERNRKLVDLVRDVPGVPSWDSLVLRDTPVSALLAFYRRYELNAFANALSTPELF